MARLRNTPKNDPPSASAPSPSAPPTGDEAPTIGVNTATLAPIEPPKVIPTPTPAGRPIEEHDFFTPGIVPRQDQRPVKQSILAEMAAPGGPVEDLAAFFGMTIDEFEDLLDDNPNLKKTMELAAGAGRAVLRRRQYQLAKAGDPTMLRFCGEHMLGQNSKTVHAGELVVRIIKDFGDGDAGAKPNPNSPPQLEATRISETAVEVPE